MAPTTTLAPIVKSCGALYGFTAGSNGLDPNHVFSKLKVNSTLIDIGIQFVDANGEFILSAKNEIEAAVKSGIEQIGYIVDDVEWRFVGNASSPIGDAPVLVVEVRGPTAIVLGDVNAGSIVTVNGKAHDSTPRSIACEKTKKNCELKTVHKLSREFGYICGMNLKEEYCSFPTQIIWANGVWEPELNNVKFRVQECLTANNISFEKVETGTTNCGSDCLDITIIGAGEEFRANVDGSYGVDGRCEERGAVGTNAASEEFERLEDREVCVDIK